MTQEESREYYKKYREKNRDKIREKHREWYWENRDAILLMRKAKYIMKRKKKKECNLEIVPRKFYNKQVVYVIKTTKGYISRLDNIKYTYNLWEALLFKDQNEAWKEGKELDCSNVQIVQAEMRERIGIQEIFW